MSEEEVREKLYQIASDKGYKRLAKASKDYKLEFLASELLKYKNKKEIARELFGDNFTADAIIKIGGGLQKPLLRASLEVICSTDDKEAFSQISTLTSNYEQALTSVIHCVEKVAFYARDGKTIKALLHLATTYFFNLNMVMGDISRFNFDGDHEKLAEYLRTVIETHQKAIDDKS